MECQTFSVQFLMESKKVHSGILTSIPLFYCNHGLLVIFFLKLLSYVFYFPKALSFAIKYNDTILLYQKYVI